MMTLVAFLLALAVLIAVHEAGHYFAARWCGVRVLRFSLGFGKPLLTWRRQTDGCEFTVALFPLGGYVRMLDEREGPVPESQRSLAFNTQKLWKRAVIVAAGPVANLALAVLIYASLNWWGMETPAPVLASPPPESAAARAGLLGGERVQAVLRVGADDRPEPTASLDELQWALSRAALEGNDVDLLLAGHVGSTLRLPLTQLSGTDGDPELLQRIGVVAPYSPAILGRIVSGGAAEAAGLREGDKVLMVDGRAARDAAQVRLWIRQSASRDDAPVQNWRVRRGNAEIDLVVRPAVVIEGNSRFGRINAVIGATPEMVLRRYGAIDGLWRGVKKTWEITTLSLHMMARMVTRQAALTNLSGPLTIADYAGKSADRGLEAYLLFLALISVSLGVLNLLPLPVLDGGHLLYYLWEFCSGRQVSERWMETLQRGGVALLLALMSLALFNDLNRLLG